MCQIIALKTTPKKFKKIYKDDNFINKLHRMLNEKGGDYVNLSFMCAEQNMQVEGKTVHELFEGLKSFLDISKMKKNEPLLILLFSRQQPEMEIINPPEQPYVLESDDGCVFAVHGTVHNDKELAEDMGVDIHVDTEIFQYINPNDWNSAEGAYAIIGIDDTGEIFTKENGLKIWTNYLVEDGKHLADIVSTTSLDFLNPYVDNYNRISSEKKALFISFSGGMDISLSLYHELKKGNHDKVLLNYFAWGSIAETQEMKVLDDMLAFYKKEFPDIDFDLNTVDADEYFDAYFNINNAPYPRISIHSKYIVGDDTETETESPLAYVPYRNTQFAILMASMAEAANLKHVDFMFGLNLSEGMVFMDNSEGWLKTISELIKLGGKDYKISGTYNVIAPYFPRTKTNMLQEFADEHGIATLEQLLEMSKSCYYPNPDGTPCDQCGSCILRNKSISKLKIPNTQET